MGTVVILDAKNGQVVSQFSLHANKVSVLLELPLQVKPCICAELPMEKMAMSSTKSYKVSLPAKSLQREEKESSLTKKRGTSVVTKHEAIKPQTSFSSSQSRQPLFVSVGDGLANWFGNVTDATQDLHLLTWTDDYV